MWNTSDIIQDFTFKVNEKIKTPTRLQRLDALTGSFSGAEYMHADTVMKGKSFSPPIYYFNENLKKYHQLSQKNRFTFFNTVYKIVNHMVL